MAEAKKELTPAGKEQVAAALILLKDWKCEGKFDVEVTLTVLGLAEALGVKAEYEKLMPTFPVMRIEPR